MKEIFTSEKISSVSSPALSQSLSQSDPFTHSYSKIPHGQNGKRDKVRVSFFLWLNIPRPSVPKSFKFNEAKNVIPLSLIGKYVSIEIRASWAQKFMKVGAKKKSEEVKEFED